MNKGSFRGFAGLGIVMIATHFGNCHVQAASPVIYPRLVTCNSLSWRVISAMMWRTKRNPIMHRTGCLALIFASVVMLFAPANTLRADDKSEKPGKPSASEQPIPDFPHLKIDRKKRYVDLEGAVVLREADWIELLACMPRSRVHESLITIKAKPSHIHGAMLIAGYKPGNPWKAEKIKDTWKYFPATGELVELKILYKDKKGKTIEVSPSEWIIESQTKKKLPDSLWMFTGSRILNIKGRDKPLYAADLEGNLFTLVNFGDEVFARQTKLEGGQGGAGGDTWSANTKLIPPVGTKLILRIQPAKKGAKPKDVGAAAKENKKAK